MLRRAAIVITAAVTALVSVSRAAAQTSFGFAYYDVDRLYDTVPSPFVNDSNYTPQGRLKWNGERYRRKVQAVAAATDSMAMPVTALFGVENEQVVRDIAACCKGGYSYLHRTSDRFDGLDFALLYYGDMLFPTHVQGSRTSLTVVAQTACGARVVFILAKRAANIDMLVAKASEADAEATIIVAGEFSYADLDGLGLEDALRGAEAAGQGNVLGADGWKMSDRIAVTAGSAVRAGVYARRYMFDATGAPAPTYDRNAYRGGAGRRLPIWCEVKTVGRNVVKRPAEHAMSSAADDIE